MCSTLPWHEWVLIGLLVVIAGYAGGKKLLDMLAQSMD